MPPADWIETPEARFRWSDFKDKKAIITGSSSGIGKATMEMLLENGAEVFGISLDRIETQYPGLTQMTCDLADAGQIATVFAEIARTAPYLDYVVNVAGIDPKYPIDDVTPDQWDSLVDLNLKAYYFVIKNALPLLRSGAGRAIVNVSSINYRLGVPGRAAYSASKAGILGLTTGLSRELGAENIRINTVTPGWIFTERQVAEYFRGEKAEKKSGLSGAASVGEA